MRTLFVAVLIAAGLSGCSRGPSCADLTSQLEVARIEIQSAQAMSDITGDTTKITAALAKQQSLTDAFVSKGCSS